MWHQHQPLYPKDFDGVVTRPWVRLHAAKDYLDMAALVGEFPELQVTFNLTPTLLLQLEDLTDGGIDSYWEHTVIPATDLTVGQRRFVVERFFDVNPRIIDRFPRYGELAAMRTVPPDEWEDQDITDLQVLFNLAWTDPSFLEQEPLAALVEEGRGFHEEDKETVLAEHLRIVGEVIPLHAEMWEGGQIEVTTTPLAHPSFRLWQINRWRRWATRRPCYRDRIQRGARRRRAGHPWARHGRASSGTAATGNVAR